MAGYHINEIKKGLYAQPSKIREEFEEFMDAYEQDNKVMMLVELADLLGAIEGYTESNHGITLEDLIKMKEATKRAFKEGHR